MPRPAASLLALALVATAAIAFGGCGEEDAQLLPGGTAREITANLDTVQQLADEGDCLGAESAALQVSEQVEALEGVDERLKRALREGAARLNEVVTECEEEVEAVPEVTTTETEPTAPDEEDKEKQKEKGEDDGEQDEGEDEPEEEGEEVEETEPTLPPQAKGEGKGAGNGNGPSGGEGGGSPSGGLSPGSPAGEGE